MPAAANTLRFEYAAATFQDETATEYQTRLEGLDEDWSPWSRETRRDVTNLGSASYYGFRVRARSVAGQVSGDAVYASCAGVAGSNRD